MDVPTVEDILGWGSPDEALFDEMTSLAVLLIDPDRATEPNTIESTECARQIANTLEGSHDRIDSYISSLTSGIRSDFIWHELLLEASNQVSAAALNATLADGCTRLFDDDGPVGGLYLRRVDAILDLLDTPFAARDVQDLYVTLTVALAKSKLSSAHKGGAAALEVAGGFAGGFLFMPFLTTAAVKGAEILLDEFSKTDELTQKAARLVVGAAILADIGENDAFAYAEEIYRRLRELADDASQDLARLRTTGQSSYIGEGARPDARARVLRSAANFAMSILEEARPGSVQVRVPNVIGHPLSEAAATLESLGCTVTAITGDDRWVMNKASWIVTKQKPDPGGKPGLVTLSVKKYSD